MKKTRRTFRFFRHALPLAALLALGAQAAQAECRGGAVPGSSPMCTGDPPSSSGSDVYIPYVDPAYEALQQNIRIYQERFNSLYENSRALERFAGMPAPVSEDELSRRIDDIFAAAWPEYRTNALQTDLYRRQTAFFENHNGRLRREIGDMKNSLAAARADNPALARQAQETEDALNKSRDLESELTRIGLTQLNSPAAERLVMAYLMIFSPDAGITAARLNAAVAYSELPGALPPPVHYATASLAPPWAEDRPPETPGELTVSPPAPGTPLQDKFAAMQSLNLGMQQDWADQPVMRDRAATLKREYDDLKSEKTLVSADLGPLMAEKNRLQDRLGQAREQLAVSGQNGQNAARVIMTETAVDLALAAAAVEMRKIVEKIAHAEGLGDKIPGDKTDAILKMAREGGQMLLPHRGYEKQWAAFTKVQKQTLDVLDRAQGFMTAAAHLAATGSPEEMEELLERVFGSVKWETARYIQTTGWSVMPEQAKTSRISKVFEKFLANKAKKTGD